MLRLDTRQAIAQHLDLIRDLFKPGAKLTLLVRNPEIEADADVLFTSDTLPEVVASIRHREATDKKIELPKAYEDPELRDGLAEIVEQIIDESSPGLDHPRALDAALDAILTTVDVRYERKLG